jgi:hypothetical protein
MHFEVRRSTWGGAFALLAIGAAILWPHRAEAASYNGRCESGEVCLFEHSGASGQVLFDRYAAGGCWHYDLPWDRRDTASSFANRTGRWVDIGSYGPAHWWVRSVAPWLWADLGGSFNDQADWVSVCY